MSGPEDDDKKPEQGRWIDQVGDLMLKQLERDRLDPDAALERERKDQEHFKPSSLIPGPAIGLPESFKKKRALNDEDTAAVSAYLATVYPDLPALAEKLITTKVEPQPYFRNTRIVNVLIDRHPPPPLTVYVAIGAGGALSLLSGRPQALHDVARADPPTGLDRAGTAQGYARDADRWTSGYEYGYLAVDEFDDIPWRRRLDDRDKARLEDARGKAAGLMSPEHVEEVPGGHRVSLWVVAHQKLIHRHLTVLPDGELRREDDVIAEKIPTYLGKLWDIDARGRRIPSG